MGFDFFRSQRLGRVLETRAKFSDRTSTPPSTYLHAKLYRHFSNIVQDLKHIHTLGVGIHTTRNHYLKIWLSKWWKKKYWNYTIPTIHHMTQDSQLLYRDWSCLHNYVILISINFLKTFYIPSTTLHYSLRMAQFCSNLNQW